MNLKTLAGSLTSVFIASLAHAQAPLPDGAPSPAAPDSIPVAAPPVMQAGMAAPCEDCRESVMANRWSIGLSLGSMGLAARHSHDDRADFAVAELALRFRATRHLELELASAGGQDPDDDVHPNYLRVNAVTLAARYHFLPEAKWNWFVMGGLGAATIAVHDATDQQRQDAVQPLAMVGVGVERRFDHFALQVELRAIDLDKRTTTTDTAAMTTSATSMSTTTTIQPARSGGSFTVGLSYYF
jgi:hypothetical protein